MRTLSVNPWDLVNLDPTEELPDELARLFWYRRPLDRDNPMDGLHLIEELINDGRDQFLRLVKLDRLREILPDVNLRRSNMRFWEDMLNFYSYPERNTVPVIGNHADDTTYRINALEAKVHGLEKALGEFEKEEGVKMDHREWEDVLAKLKKIVSDEVIDSENRFATMAFPAIMDGLGRISEQIHELKMEVNDLRSKVKK